MISKGKSGYKSGHTMSTSTESIVVYYCSIVLYIISSMDNIYIQFARPAEFVFGITNHFTFKTEQLEGHAFYILSLTCLQLSYPVINRSTTDCRRVKNIRAKTVPNNLHKAATSPDHTRKSTGTSNHELTVPKQFSCPSTTM